MNHVSRGVVLATAVATLVATSAVAVQAQSPAGGEVKCAGLNECKGKGGCKSTMNECKGKNDCKGKGFVMTKSAAECTQKGGKVLAESK
jgi:hypothetical protein